MKKKTTYLAFLLFLLVLTFVLSGLLVNKILKNEASNDVRYLKTTISNNDDKLAMVTLKNSNIKIVNIQSEETPVILEYEYKIKIDGIVGKIKCKYKNNDQELVFNENNEAIVNIKSNEEFILYDIPVNTKYTIEQNLIHNYKTLSSGESTNIFNGTVKDENIVEFKNISSIVVTNPNTADNNVIVFILCDILVFMTFIVLKKTKVQRYETQNS